MKRPANPRVKDIFAQDQQDQAKPFGGLSTTSKIFVIVILLESLVLIGLTVERIVAYTHEPLEEEERHIKEAILILLNSVFLSLYAIYGVINESKFELVTFVVVSLAMAGMVGAQIQSDQKLISWIRFAIGCMFSVLNIFLSIVVYCNFGWKVFRKIGASRELIDCYQDYQIFSSLLKMDLLVGINLVLIAGFFLYNDYELYIDIAAMVVSFVWALIGWTAGRRENRKLCSLFLVLAFIQPAYVVFKLVQYSIFDREKFEGWIEPLLFGIGILDIIVRICLVISTIRVSRNFGKGLKQVLSKEEEYIPIRS